jgi:triosephosphate isomerase (TIM)
MNFELEEIMRKQLVAGNWKMNKTVEQARLLVTEMIPELQAISSVERVLCPPFTSLVTISAMLAGTDIKLGAQNMHWEASGAYTGEISPQMVAENCQFVIIGHSERRKYLHETDETVNLKIKAAIGVFLIPIVCVGETLEENEAGQTAEVITRQLIKGLAGFSPEDGLRMVIAYEPVWAIGTGRAATAPGANAVISEVIRPGLTELFNSKAAQEIRVLYGGSVTPANATELFAQPDIDGGLVGGASLKAADFIKIVKSVM